MHYAAEISRTNPTCFLFLIDQSTSMAGPFGGQPGKKKADGVADAINRLLQNLALKRAKSDGIRDYFHVGVIGYGKEVHSALGGTLAGKRLVPISLIANNPVKPLRVFLEVGENDNGATAPESGHHNWVMANQRTAAGKGAPAPRGHRGAGARPRPDRARSAGRVASVVAVD